MPPVAMVFGVLLILLGVGGYFGAEPENRSWTALIPTFVGVPLLLLGILGQQESRRKHAMHAAAALGVLGFLAPAVRLSMTMARGTFAWGLPTISQTIMIVLCGVFVALCVKSFIDARRARRTEENASPSAS